MYADDTLVYYAINDINDYIQLQGDLLSIEKWAEEHQMQFNPAECEFLAMRNKKSSIGFL